jgi:hypothetical protein
MKTKLKLLRLSILGIAILFSAARIKAQDIHVVTTTKTNLETQTIIVTDIYTRDGLTNLVCQNEFVDGKQGRNQKIYHDGVLLGTIHEVNGLAGISTEPNPTYSLTFAFAADKTLQPAALQGATINSNYFLVDAFDCTNGVLSPMESSKINKARDIDAGMGKIFDPENLNSKSPEEIVRETQKLIETNKSK